MTIRILAGDCRDVLRTLPDASVQCCVTSPPYWGLRDYGTAVWTGGNHAGCDHSRSVWDGPKQTQGAQSGHASKSDRLRRRECVKCGATRIDSQIGLENSPDAYVAEMVAVFREVRRVLRDDGTLWLNMGDAYCNGTKADRNPTSTEGPSVPASWSNRSQAVRSGTPAGLKTKDLIGLPWMVAFALRADGWYLRQDNIWAKRNCMPESIRDRTTRAHEYVFLLTKSPRYFYDAVAIEEEGDIPAGTKGAKGSAERAAENGVNARPPEYKVYTGKRNKRSVWHVATQPFAEAHFATMPPAIVETCVLAGTSEKGCCSACGSPWVRQINHSVVPGPKAAKTFVIDSRDLKADANDQGSNRQKDGHKPGYQSLNTTTGWLPSCECDAGIVPCTVLDPFGGAGTTALVADRLGRHATLIELNPEYIAIVRRRLTKDAGMFADLS